MSSGNPATDPSLLAEFLSRAYDVNSLSEIIRSRLLGGGHELAALVPLRAHLTKDTRLIVGYRMDLFSPRDGGLRSIPVFLHYAGLTREPVLKSYRSLSASSDRSQKEGGLRRHFFRTDEEDFLALFPLDPELRTAARMLRPASARDLYNRELAQPDYPTATGVALRLLGYRPERRIIVGVTPVTPEGPGAELAVKFYRRGEAGRVWEMTRSLASTGLASLAAWPVAHAPASGALATPLVPGETLHTLLERSWATPAHLEQTGRILRKFHGALTAAPETIEGLRRFSWNDELEILERWRRFLKRMESPEHGFVASHLRRLEAASDRAPEAAALVHRDFYPKQILVHPWTGRQTLIDIDTLAWGPPAVDLGNFVAHLRLAGLAGAQPPEDSARFEQAFLQGYGVDPSDPAVHLFTLSTLLRLFCLALVAPDAATITPGLRASIRSIAEDTP